MISDDAKRARMRRRMTLTDAAKLGVLSRRSIARLESGECLPRGWQRYIARLLDCDRAPLRGHGGPRRRKEPIGGW